MSQSKLCVLYIPGLGDTKISGQQRAIATWKLWGVHGEVLQMHWASNESWDDKLERLLAKIDKLISAYDKVAIVGVSAGASAVINAYSLRKHQLVGCVLIAGKVNHPAAIGQRYRRENPALLDSAQEADRALAGLTPADRQRILSRFAAFDPIVPRKDSYITGAHNQMLATVGHIFTIATQITLGAPFFLSFLKALAQKDLVS